MDAIEFSVPYNGDPNALQTIFDMKRSGLANIREVFLSGPVEYCASGRVAYTGDLDGFSQTVSSIHQAGIRVNLVMNSTCEGVEWYSDGMASYMQDFVTYMVQDLGVEAITMANPIIMAQVHAWVPEAELCASVLGDVDCVERARAFELAGATVCTPDVNINRDLHMLRRIRQQTGLELKIMVNEGCLYKCPFRKFHFNAISHIQRNSSRVGKGLTKEQFKAQCDQVAGRTFFGSCSQILAHDPSQILKSGWIRPEDLDEYADITRYFKISGRTCATSAVERMIRAYAMQSYDGDLLDIMDSSLRSYSMGRGASVDNVALGEAGFFHHVAGCDRDCGSCGYCDRLAQQVVRLDAPTRIKQEDRAFLAG